jgi:hypothetical protein
MSWEGGVAPPEGDLGFTALAGPPLPPDRPLLRCERPLAGPAMSSASESLELTEADLL